MVQVAEAAAAVAAGPVVAVVALAVRREGGTSELAHPRSPGRRHAGSTRAAAKWIGSVRPSCEAAAAVSASAAPGMMRGVGLYAC